jgi:hypothetical protein
MVSMLALLPAAAHAQAIGTIFGKVTDPSGAVLPGVTVTVTGPSLQQPLVAVTSENGTYQFQTVPVGTTTVTFELASFKKAVRPNVVITSGFNAQVDQKLEIGQMTEEVTISAVSPVVDTKKTTTGGTFTAEVLDKIPVARDPQQIVNMAPGIQLSGINVGGSASGQQLTFTSRGSSASVQWNLEGGSITDLSSNSSPSYFDFESFDQVQVVTGGGDVSIQSQGVAVNLVTKSGSNVFKGSFTGTFENDKMQAQNVTQSQFNAGQNGFLSGNPLKKVDVASVEYGGPILKNRLWFWGAWDRQDINVGILNFFDPSLGTFCQQLSAAQASKTLGTLATYDKISDVQHCLKTDHTLIRDINWKINYQINSSNKIQWLYEGDSKYRNARSASATRAPEDSFQQGEPSRSFPVPWNSTPIESFTHTWIANDKLVFTNQLTYAGGGFTLDYQDVPPQGSCGATLYNGSTSNSGYVTDPSCLWNIQALTNRTTAYQNRSLLNSYQTVRKRWEVKTDGTYFLTHKLGGDHSLKFGLGYQKAPVSTFSHYSGGARATVECVGNATAGCGDGNFALAGSAAGLVPYQAVLYRDQLLNNNWWTYNGYVQDSYSKGKWRLNGGVRYDWQQSKYLGGCVAANPIRPDLLPSQCESATQSDSVTGRKIRPFSNWSPRVSATYDLFGNGKTQVHGSASYYYNTRIVLANALGGLFSQPSLTWGPNLSSGLCSTTANAPCWNDANGDGLVQANELIGTPSVGSSQANLFDLTTGQFHPAGNIVDPSAQIGRTREGIVGFQHELIPNLAVGVDYIYRKYDRGTATYVVGTQPGGANFPLAQIYVPATYTDPVTGITAQYYQVCATCTRPTGANITVTNIENQTYQGVDITATKRFSNHWQMQSGVTVQNNPQFFPVGSTTFNSPTGQVYRNGVSTLPTYLWKLAGSYQFPWDISFSENFNWQQGATRTETINGPGSVFGGVGQGNLTLNTLEFQDRDKVRFADTKILDLSLSKTIRFSGGRYRLKLTGDAFNVFNQNVILSYSSNNASTLSFTSPASIVPPRVFRVGITANF